ncbi:MAG: hypothetical protein A3I83_08910 [Methylotenera sp. RIFCSPLOWO2_02_FULL_45_14]|nr:MAG: hypothetical protein A3I83_08910 [Methylotenera sp. RIFCSPLOWO2_02_FULL_45_14]
MITLTLSLDSTVLHVVAADIVILFTYVLYLFQKKRKIEKSINSITEFITEYFQHTGAEVQVTCFKLEANKHFVTLIESKPLKRFRFSNILESNLISHIYKKTGNVVVKIYWRFPVQVQDEVIITEQQVSENPDDLYFVEMQAAAETGSAYKVSEATWDEFKNQKQ